MGSLPSAFSSLYSLVSSKETQLVDVSNNMGWGQGHWNPRFIMHLNAWDLNFIDFFF